jgi:nucleoside-diphosphate-sugar epimerase
MDSMQSSPAVAPNPGVITSKPTSTRWVAITGANGFIGSRLTERLASSDGHRVRGTVRSEEAAQKVRKAKAEATITSLEDVDALTKAFEGVSVVYHVAGELAALDEARIMKVNEQGTRNVAEACARQPKPPTLVYLSSIAAAGPAARGAIRVEADVPAPVSLYGRSKLAAERAAAKYADRVPISIVRPAIVFGPGSHDQCDILLAIRRLRFHAIVGWRTPLLSFIHVDDLVDQLIAVADRGERVPASSGDRLAAGTGVYFAAGTEFVTYAEWGQMAKPMLHRPYAPNYPIPKPIAWLIAWCNEGLSSFYSRPSLLTRDKIREATVASWAASGDKARRELGLTEPKSLKERLAETIAWYFENKWL